MTSCWTWLARAIALEHVGFAVMMPGIAVQRRETGDVVVAYGGHASRVDADKVTAAARAAVTDWPYELTAVEIFTTPDPPKNKWTRRARQIRGLA